MPNTKDLIAKYGQAVQYLPPRLRGAAMAIDDAEKLRAEEFRLRAGRCFSVCISGEERVISSSSAVRHEELQTVLELATKSSVHTAAASIREGFVTVQGGHRIGICGTAVRSPGGGMRDISSVSVRIAKSIDTAAENIVRDVMESGTFRNTIIISPPGFGKTTALRDFVRRLSDSGKRISLVDERGEIAAKHRGMPQFDVGRCTDVLDGIDKASGAMLMLRAMTPDIIALDEITAERDIEAISMIANCGVGILATAHGENAESIAKRPLYRRLFELDVFRVAIRLEKHGDKFSHCAELL